MRARTEDDPSSGSPLGIPLSAVAREAARALIAFALYLGLYPLWERIGGHGAYEALILGIAGPVVVATQHFPAISALENLSLEYLDFLLLLTFSYFIVSWRIRWGSRLRRFAALLAAIVVLHVVAVVFEIKLDSTVAMGRREGISLLLPAELRLLEGMKYLLVDLGLQIGPFVVMLLAAAWNAGLGLPARLGGEPPAAGGEARGRRPASRFERREWLRRIAAAGLGALLLCGLGCETWRAWRESDPRHLEAHVAFADRFYRDGRLVEAEEQYRAAIEGGSTEGVAWINLADILRRRGNRSGAIDLLRTGVGVVDDAEWRRRLREELAHGGAAP